ncbi:MAG: hypothetical protein HQK54_15160 [Oligoflexales bacterium]|nr:hypothetical protein [Oligoflexales bacterium]
MVNKNKKTPKFVSSEELAFLSEQMNKKYIAYLTDGKSFKIDARLEDNGVFVTTLLKNPDDSFYYPVEARVDFRKEGLTPYEAGLFLIDYIDIYFEEYLTETDILTLPIDWTLHSYDAVDFHIKGQILNLKLERMADELINSSIKK